MIKQHIKLLSAVCLLVLILAGTAPLVSAQAGAPTITDVNPKVIVNNVSTDITITGTSFADLAQVSIGSTSIVVTSFSPTQLIARIPAGFDPGQYSVTVTNPGTPAQLFTYSDPGLRVQAPTPTSTPAVAGRPQVVIDAYSISVDLIRYNQDFTLNVSLDNAGGSTAMGLQVTFASTDLLMLMNGGVVAAGDLGVVGKANISQKMTAAAALTGVKRVSLDMTVTYSDDKGTPYSDKFTLLFPVASTGSGSSQPTSTPTPSSLERSQLVITDYQTDVIPLQPGYEFTLSINVQNVGNIAAKGVTMILGGGSSSGSASGTPQPGGISGGSGEFSNFAPVGTSNIQSLGNFAPGDVVKAKQKLVVNVSANPGAYPVKITFSYTDAHGLQMNDDQVITLLVYSLPNVDVTFYQPVSDFMVGMPGPLPLQVTSLGKRTSVLGKMKVESKSGLITNGEGLVGSLDPGAYYTLDAVLTPDSPGPQELTITIEYIDDFNQAQSITKTLSVNVMDAQIIPTPGPDTSGGGTFNPTAPQTVWQKIWRFILGIFGLDSSAPTDNGGGGNSPLPTQIPAPIIKPGGKG